MEQEQMTALSRPFVEIRTRPGRSGQPMSYIEGHQVVQRLNDALGGDWSFKVLEHQVLEAEAVVLGELRAGDVVKQAFGGSEIARSREGKVVSVADDLKAAATDSLKKAATLLGVGLRLHRAEEVVPAPKPKGPKLVPREAVVEQQAEGAAGPTQGPQAPEGNRLTKRQAGFIEKLAKANGMTAEELEEFALEKCGRPCAQLTVQQASELIRVLGRPA